MRPVTWARASLRSVLTWGVVAAVAVAGLTGLEVWPLTGWRLFSERRYPVVTRYEARVVQADGVETRVPFGDLPHSFSGSDPVLRRMAGQRPEGREPACAALADATARLTRMSVSAVRVYEVADDLRDGSHRTALAWTCGRRAP